MNRTLEVRVSTFNDGINNIYYTIPIDRWYDEKHNDYVFTFNGEIEHLDKSPSFVNIIKKVYGDWLLDFKIIKDITRDS